MERVPTTPVFALALDAPPRALLGAAAAAATAAAAAAAAATPVPSPAFASPELGAASPLSADSADLVDDADMSPDAVARRCVMARGARSREGENNSNHKIQEALALEIWKGLQSGKKAPKCAEEFGVSVHIVRSIKYGKRWTHVTGLHKKKHVAPSSRAASSGAGAAPARARRTSSDVSSGSGGSSTRRPARRSTRPRAPLDDVALFPHGDALAYADSDELYGEDDDDDDQFDELDVDDDDDDDDDASDSDAAVARSAPRRAQLSRSALGKRAYRCLLSEMSPSPQSSPQLMSPGRVKRALQAHPLGSQMSDEESSVVQLLSCRFQSA